MGILRTNEISGLETPTAVTGSVSFDGTGDYLQLADSESWYFGSGNFTVEAWVYYTGSNDRVYVYSQVESFSSNNNRFQMYYSGSNWTIFHANAGGSTQINISKPDTLIANTWFHIAFVKSGTTYYIFKNGNLLGSGTDTDEAPSLAADVYIGTARDDNTQKYFTGYISNLRVLKGTALYTSDFTPPVHELQPIGDTVLLCCNNPDSAGAEATGKTITVNGDAAASTVSPGLTRDFTFGTQFQGVAKFDTQGYFVPPSGTTEQRGRGRGVFAGGNSSNTISYVTIATTGNSSDFGDLLASRSGLRGGSSATRGLFTHSSISPYINTIEYVTISSTGNAIDFGDMLGTSSSGATGSNSTRSVFWEGTVPSTGVQICYVTTASLGNASEFGDMFIGVRHIDTMNSPTRCIVAGGWKTSPDSNTNVIQYITFATTGDAVEFGDVVGTTNGIRGNASTSSSTRGVYAGGANSPGNTAVNTIEYLTMSSLGNTQDFGDLSIAKRTEGGGTSNGIRGIFAGGYSPAPANFNTIEYITIASTGDAMDFGDLSSQTKDVGACSDSHGGIS